MANGNLSVTQRSTEHLKMTPTMHGNCVLGSSQMSQINRRHDYTSAWAECLSGLAPQKTHAADFTSFAKQPTFCIGKQSRTHSAHCKLLPTNQADTPKFPPLNCSPFPSLKNRWLLYNQMWALCFVLSVFRIPQSCLLLQPEEAEEAVRTVLNHFSLGSARLLELGSFALVGFLSFF